MERDQATIWLLTCGVAAPILFIIVFLIDGASP